MYSLLFLNNNVLKFRYDMKAIKNIQDIGIDLMKDDLRRITNKQLGRLSYLGVVDISYREFMDLMTDNATTIINFAIDDIQRSFEVPEIEKKDEDVEWDWGDEWEGIEKVEFKEKEIVEVEYENEEINTDTMLKSALSIGIGSVEFWNLTPRELFMQINVYKDKYKAESDNLIYLHYLNAYLARVKRMPPITDFVKIKQTVMTDEQLFGVVSELDKIANAD